MKPGDVRVATPADAEVLAALLEQFHHEFNAPSDPAGEVAERLGRLLHAESAFAILVGDPAHGLAIVTERPSLWADGPLAMLDELYVIPELRGRGIGSTLVRTVREVASQRGLSGLEILVDEDDHEARRFYEKHGLVSGTGRAGARALYYAGDLA